VLVAVVVAASLTWSLEPASAGTRTKDRPRTGYHLRHTGTAAGDWLGSRSLGRSIVYRVDPRRAPVARGFGPAQWVADLRGTGRIETNRNRTRRAAWLVSKYGTYRSASQSAAVELALHALLVGGPYALGGSRTHRRLRQTGDAAVIVPLARYMLEKSRLYAGPYRVRLTGTGAVVGERVRVGTTVSSRRRGKPVASLPVDVRFAGRTMRATTDATGTVSVNALSTAPGPQRLVVAVHKVPSHQLRVRRPSGGHGSRVVLAGQKLTLTRTISVDVRARPTVGVSAPDSRTTAAPVPGTVHLRRGYPGPREAEVTLYGPFGTAAAAVCHGGAPVVGTGPVDVEANGTYAVPPIEAATPGFYRWGVAVPGDRFNLPASSCGHTILLKGVPRLILSTTKPAIPIGGKVAAEVEVRRLPDWFDRDVVVRLYGPFASRDRVRCLDALQVARRLVRITGPTDLGTTATVRLSARGFYGWRAVVPESRRSARVISPCARAGTTVRVGPAG
jgi:hypothetical protein